MDVLNLSVIEHDNKDYFINFHAGTKMIKSYSYVLRKINTSQEMSECNNLMLKNNLDINAYFIISNDFTS